MDLKLLEDLICLSETRSFSRSAELRGISQSTLSKRIRLLEGWVGTVLIDRSSYPVELTAKGRKVVAQAREAAALMAAMREAPSPRKRAGSVGIVGMHTLLRTMVPLWRDEIRRRGMRLLLDRIIQNNVYADNVEMFRAQEADLFVTFLHKDVAMDLPLPELNLMSLGHETIIAVSAPDAAGAPLHRVDADTFCYLGYSPGSFFHDCLRRTLDAIPHRVEVAANPMSVGLRSLALMGTGAAWLPEKLVAPHLRSGALVPCCPGFNVTVQAALIRHRTASAPAETLWRLSQDLFVGRRAVR